MEAKRNNQPQGNNNHTDRLTWELNNDSDIMSDFQDK